MGSLVPQTGNGLSVYEAPDNPWAEAAASVDQGAYLKFNGNTGEFTYGADDNELPYGSQIVADMFSVAFGWICWKDGDPVEEVLVKVLDGKPPLEHTLTDHGPYDEDGDGWRESTSVPMVLLEFGDKGEETDIGLRMLFKGSSASTVRGVRKLSGAFGKLFREKQGMLPVIEIDAEQFQAREKKHGKKYAPIFKIVGWISDEELTAVVGEVGDVEGDYEPEPQPEPKRVTQRRQPEPEPEPEPEVEQEEEPAAPASRRRAAEEAAPREPVQAPRTRRQAAPAAEEELAAPEPRGRSPERGDAPGGRRVRRFG